MTPDDEAQKNFLHVGSLAHIFRCPSEMGLKIVLSWCRQGTFIRELKVESLRDWTLTNSLDFHIVSEQVHRLSLSWLPLQYQRSVEKASDKPGLSFEKAFRKLILPAFDLLLGDDVAKAALGSGPIDLALEA